MDFVYINLSLNLIESLLAITTIGDENICFVSTYNISQTAAMFFMQFANFFVICFLREVLKNYSFFTMLKGSLIHKIYLPNQFFKDQ